MVELLRGVEYLAQMESLLGVCVVVGSNDGTKNTRSPIIVDCRRRQPVNQLVTGFAESLKDEFDLPGTARDVVV